MVRTFVWFLLSLVVFVQGLSDPTCTQTSGDIYVEQKAYNSGTWAVGDGTVGTPYSSLLVALQCLARGSSHTSTVYLMVDKTKVTADQVFFRLAEGYDTGDRDDGGVYLPNGRNWDRPLGYHESTDSDHRVPIEAGSVITIKTYECPLVTDTDCSDDVTTNKATISWWNKNVQFNVNTQFELKLENVDITSDPEYFVTSCAAQWCRHCGLISMLQGTNANSGVCEDADTDECTTATGYSLAAGGGGDKNTFINNLDNDKNSYCDLNRVAASASPDSLHFFMVRADQSGLAYPNINAAVLEFVNVKVHNFRARLDAFIVMYNGKLKFNNVEFEHIEPGALSVPSDGASGLINGFIVGGVVPDSEAGDYNCKFDGGSNGIRPCYEFEWDNDDTITGGVTYLNSDINIADSTREDNNNRYRGFLYFDYAAAVTITNVKFKYNVIPSEPSESGDSTESLLEFNHSAFIKLDGCEFQYNAMQRGIVKATFNPEVIPYGELLTADIHFHLLGVLFEKNLITSQTDSAVVFITTTLPVNIKFEKDASDNLTQFLYNHSHTNGNVGVYIYCSENDGTFTGVDGVTGQYAHPGSNIDVTVDPTYATIEDTEFENNWGAQVFNVSGALGTIAGWSTINFTRSHFEDNGAYATNTQWATWSAYQYYIDNNLIRQHFMPLAAYQPATQQECIDYIYLQTQNINFDGYTSQKMKIKGTDCQTTSLQIVNIELYKATTLEYIHFAENDVNLDSPVGFYVFGDTTDTITIQNSEFNDNKNKNTTNGAGAGFVTASSVASGKNVFSFQSCTFDNNEAVYAPALKFVGTSLTINECDFRDNTATNGAAAAVSRAGNGGAISYTVNEPSALTITDSSFNGNAAMQNAADIFIDRANTDVTNVMTLVITGTTFTSATSEQGAGSIYLEAYMSQTGTKIENCTWSTCTSAQGIIHTSFIKGYLEVKSCTFSNNDSVIWLAESNSGVTIFYGNIALSQAGGGSDLSKVKFESCRFEGNKVQGIAAPLDDTTTALGLMYFEGEGDVEFATCQFENNLATTYYCTKGNLVENGSTWRGNSCAQGCAIYADTSCQVTATGSTINTNESKAGGAGMIFKASGVRGTLSTLTFHNNTARTTGGALFIENDATVAVTSSTFTDNKGLLLASVCYIVSTNASVQLFTSNTFTGNKSEGTFYMFDAVVQFTSNYWDGNLKETESNGIIALKSTITSTSNRFTNHDCESGCYFYLFYDSELTDNNSTFENSFNLTSGGVIKILAQSQATFNGSKIQNCEGTAGPVVAALDTSQVFFTNAEITNVRFKQDKAGQEDISKITGLMDLSQSRLTLTSTTIKNSDFRGIYSTNSDSIEITNSVFEQLGIRTQDEGIDGGALYSLSSEVIEIKGSTFLGNKAEKAKGGAIFIEGTYDFAYTIQNCNFTSNEAAYGGAVYTERTLEILGTYFGSNLASNYTDDDTGTIDGGSGGAIYFDCATCNGTFNTNNFENNAAVKEGGAIKTNNNYPTLTDNTFSKNVAPYGPDEAYYPIKLVQIVEGRLRQLQTTSSLNISSVQSGGENNNIELALVDKLGATVSSIGEDASCTMVSNSNNDWRTPVLGGGSVTAFEGVFYFDSLSITAEPGSSGDISVTTTAIVATKDTDNSQVILPLYYDLQECTYNEYYSSGRCTTCANAQQQYTLNETSCEDCPTGVTCELDDNGVTFGTWPDAGKWRASATTGTWFDCLRTESCLGSENKTSSTGACADGYHSNLCQSCKQGWSRTAKNTCDLCPDDLINSFRLITITLALVFFIIVAVRSQFMQAHKKAEIHSVYLKIFVSYLQIITLISSFNLNWPGLVQSLLDQQESAGSATRQIYSYDCFLDKFISEDVAIFFKRLVINFTIPIWYIILPFIIWSIVSWRRKSMMYMRQHYISTLIIMLFIAHPDVSTAMFASFACIEIDGGNMFLLEDLAVQCWQGDHEIFAYTVGLPGLVLWAVGIPAFALMVLRRYRKRLSEIYVRRKLGFMFMGYRHKYFFWEIIITYRKISIAFISIFLYSLGTQIQALAVMLIVMISFYLQDRFRPYEVDELNHLEMRSIIVSGITIYSGLFFLSNGLGEIAKVIFFFIIVVANVQFLIVFLQGLTRGFLIKFATAKPRLARRYLPCIGYVFRAANDALGVNCPEPLERLRPLNATEMEVMNEEGAFVKHVFNRKYARIINSQRKTMTEDQVFTPPQQMSMNESDETV